MAGFSSEHNILIAAFMLPSSTLAVTAAASISSAFFLSLDGAERPGLSSVRPAAPAVVLFLMMDAKLWRFPVLAGFRRMDPPKLSRLRHASGLSGCDAMLFNILDSRVAHADLADFGMCLISPPRGRGCVKTGWVIGVVEIDDAITVVGRLDEVDGDICVLVEACDSEASLTCMVSGGLSDPGHGLLLGPWRWTVPFFK